MDALLALMQQWPRSWAGCAQDVPVGRALVQILRPFVIHLYGQTLSPRTVRRHLDNTWLIGGEIIRRINDEPRLRRTPPHELLIDAVAAGEAPLVDQLNEVEQAALDATARKLLRFLSSSTSNHPLASQTVAPDEARPRSHRRQRTRQR